MARADQSSVIFAFHICKKYLVSGSIVHPKNQLRYLTMLRKSYLSLLKYFVSGVLDSETVPPRADLKRDHLHWGQQV